MMVIHPKWYAVTLSISSVIFYCKHTSEFQMNRILAKPLGRICCAFSLKSGILKMYLWSRDGIGYHPANIK